MNSALDKAGYSSNSNSPAQLLQLVAEQTLPC